MKNECFDLSGLEQYVGNDPEQTKEMIQIFLDTMPAEVELIKSHAADKRWVEVYKLVHKIKPSFEVFRMTELCEGMVNIEKFTRDGYKEDLDLDKFLTPFFRDFDKVLIKLSDAKNQL